MSANSINTPVTIGDLLLKNKVVMASLTRNRGDEDGVSSDVNLEYYKQRAGAGLILAEGTLISQQGTQWPGAPGLWSQKHIEGWKTVNEAVHAHGGLIACQLWHVGRIAHPDQEQQKRAGYPVYAPSAISARGGSFHDLPGKPGYVKPTAVDDPTILIKAYKTAAENAKLANFDAVELHCANGYLVHQFIDSTSNTRTDRYGGSIENRCRFALEALDELIAVWGPGKVGVKLNPCAGYNDVGMPLDEEIKTFTYLISQINSRGIAYIQLVRYVDVMDPEIDGKKRGTKHDVLATYRSLITKSKVLANGGYSPEEAEEHIKSGLADAVVFGKAYINNPDLAERIEAGVKLNEDMDPKTFYAADSEKGAGHGYTDYPKAT